MAEFFDGGSLCDHQNLFILAMRRPRGAQHLSGTGPMGRAHQLPGPCSRSAHAQPPPVPLLDGLTGPRPLADVCPPRLVP